MHQLIDNQDKFVVWRKGLALADSLQKVADSLPSLESFNLRSIFRKMTSTIPSHIAEGLTMKNSNDRKNYCYRTLSCLEELMSSLLLTEQMGYLKKARVRKVKREIIELNRLICELVTPHRLFLNPD